MALASSVFLRNSNSLSFKNREISYMNLGFWLCLKTKPDVAPLSPSLCRQQCKGAKRGGSRESLCSLATVLTSPCCPPAPLDFLCSCLPCALLLSVLSHVWLLTFGSVILGSENDLSSKHTITHEGPRLTALLRHLLLLGFSWNPGIMSCSGLPIIT